MAFVPIAALNSANVFTATQIVSAGHRLLVGTTDAGSSAVGGIRATGASQFDSSVSLSSLAVSGASALSGAVTMSSTLAVTGNVGIGTGTLKTYEGYASATIGNNGGGGVLAFRSSYNGGDGAEIYQHSAGDLIFNINSATTGARIAATGQLLVGTSSAGSTTAGGIRATGASQFDAGIVASGLPTSAPASGGLWVDTSAGNVVKRA
jgi:hypothetical protein